MLRYLHKNGPMVVMSYNVLADCMTKDAHFTHCPPEELDFAVRKHRLLNDILAEDPDVLGLVECDHFEDFWLPQLQVHNYNGYFAPKTDKSYGVALFFKKDRLCLGRSVHLYHQNPVQIIVSLKDKESGVAFLASVVHLKAKPQNVAIRRCQVDNALDRLSAVKPEKQGIIFCGDFNAEPTEVCIRMIPWPSAYGVTESPIWTTWKIREPSDFDKGGEVKHQIDYIFTDFKVVDVMLPPNVADLQGKGLPNRKYPSDHIPVVAAIQLGVEHE